MIEISHTYSLTSLWQKQLAKQLIEQLGAELIAEKLLLMPKKVADGGFYYTEVMPGLSVIIWDLIFKQPILIKRLKSDDDLYIIHYDFSDEMNLIQVEEIEHKIGYKANLGLGVFDNAIDNIFQPVVGERVFAMRLLVAKDLLEFSIVKGTIRDSNKRKIKSGKNTLFFYDHIDSESKVIMHAIKNKSFLDPAFEIYLRGVALRLLAKFIDRYSNPLPMLHCVPEREVEVLNTTKEYLLDNLYKGFPGIDFLADMAGMSVSKYMSLFKKMFTGTPNNFFLREKMILANELLKSGKFDSLAAISQEVNYAKINYFTSKYFEQFGRKPSDDFVKATF
ncbi:AraC family transcriptional regulator [Flavobacterium sp. LS1R47]|uniref:AraC family transcriptional regulator n=1 Tax=Flavobacterium frigoritolerans TaxID=2987686 RepID=A0A9X3C1Q6_9FLAO|nr:AraC family transcriptional regulator [Flavobacterium frigoritolerans]MCV9932801.1 AraC family transcriptional regulator [Flavobacterium frigoritolerans]